MLQKTTRKVLLALLLGIGYFFIAFFHLLQYVPGLHCEGFGCLGQGLYEVAIGFVLFPCIAGAVTLATVTESRVRHALIALVLSVLVTAGVTSLLGAVNTIQERRNVQEGVVADEHLRAEIILRDRVLEEQRVQNQTPLSLEGVNPIKNDSGKGVFQAKVSPDEVLIGGHTPVVVSAEIGTVREVQSVTLYHMVSAGLRDQSIPPVLMHDDGLQGDARAHDTVFSVELPFVATAEGQERYEIEVIYTDGWVARSNQSLVLDVYQPIASEVLTSSAEFPSQVMSNYLQYRKTMSARDARERIFTEVKANPKVTAVTLDRINLSLVYQGIRLSVQLYGPMDGPAIN